MKKCFILNTEKVMQLFGCVAEKKKKKVGTVGNSENENEKSNNFKVGDVVKTDDLEISFLSAEKHETKNELKKKKKWNEYYRMKFEFKNIGDSDQVVSSLANWNCYADDYSAEQAYVGDDQMDGTISTGKKLKGSVYFEVPKKAKKITLEYECNFWTEDKVIFVVKK